MFDSGFKAVIASEAKQSILSLRGAMDCFASLAMTLMDTPSRSRGGIRPSLAIQLPALSKQRARGRPGARCTRGLVCNVHLGKSAHEHTGSAETLRPSPRNGFTAYNALSSVTGFLATVAPEKRLLLTNLTPASGRQNHTTSPYASRTVRQRRIRVHRIPPQRTERSRSAPLVG